MQIRDENTQRKHKKHKKRESEKNETGKNILQGISADVRYGVTQIKAAISP